MKKIQVTATDKGLRIESEYNRAVLKDWIAQGTVLFDLIPRIRGSKKQIGYLEGAVIPAYAHWQYGLDPRKPENARLARDLFKQDFWYTVIKDREGKPKKTLKSLKNAHREALDIYTEYAPENGAPIPNEALYKTWRDDYSMEQQYSNYYDWLDALGLDIDSMPSQIK